MIMNSCMKGKAFERAIARFMTAKTGEKWVRGVDSGARATTYGLPNLVGDILKLSVLKGKEKQDIVIECKAVGGLEITDLFNQKSILYDFIAQVKDECELLGLHDFIIFLKPNNRGLYAIYKTEKAMHLVNKLTENFSMITLPDGIVMRRL